MTTQPSAAGAAATRAGQGPYPATASADGKAGGDITAQAPRLTAEVTP